MYLRSDTRAIKSIITTVIKRIVCHVFDLAPLVGKYINFEKMDFFYRFLYVAVSVRFMELIGHGGWAFVIIKVEVERVSTYT